MQINPKLIEEIKSIIESSRRKAIKAVDHQRVFMYWHLGQRIFDEQNLMYRRIPQVKSGHDSHYGLG